MKFEKPVNENYCATVVKIKKLVPLENCDNVVGTPIFGYQAIVSKDHKIGDIGIFFPAEVQLSEDFCKNNNLFRHSELNKDKKEVGYIEDNRRVKAIKFRGNVSNGLFMPLTALKYLRIDLEELNEGNEFDKIDDKEICKKYQIQVFEYHNHQHQPKKERRVNTIHIPEHFDSEMYFRNSDTIKQNEEIIVTQKLHGTSIRIANTIVKRKKTILDRVAGLLGANIQEFEHDYIFGSRKAIKDPENKDQQDFYDVDIWTEEGEKLRGILPENYIIYGELIGWTRTGKAIQKDYTYRLPEGTCELYVYRIAIVNMQGIVTDLSWDQVVEFCKKNGLKPVPELWRGKHKNFKPEKYLDIAFNPKYKNCVPTEKGFVDEGVCIRVDKITPYILKAKSPMFLEHESKMLDTGEIDLESQASTDET